MRARLLLVLLLALVPLGARAALVLSADIHGAITPASAAYFQRAIEQARAQQAELLVLRLDTPGGLDTAMRAMIQAMLASEVPVAVYVAPGGARAASAGTYLMYASHIAAMAPGTNLGAATPVAIGPGAGDENKDSDKDKAGASDADTMKSKMVHDATAYLRSLAQLRGRNVEWAERAVRGSESLSADDALALRVIDLVAADLEELLRRIDGRAVTAAGHERRLALGGARVEPIEPTWQEQLLGTIADPNVALLLVMIGIYGLIFEFYTPGLYGPGVTGGICLLLGMYGLAMLPLNVAGVALVLLGIALMIAEAFLPTFGAIGVGGVIAFVIGALMLVDTEVPDLRVSWQWLAPIAVASALGLGALGTFALRARARPPRHGSAALLGVRVRALEDIGAEGWVEVSGERWRARSAGPIPHGGYARVTAVNGLLLSVQPEQENRT